MTNEVARHHHPIRILPDNSCHRTAEIGLYDFYLADEFLFDSQNFAGERVDNLLAGSEHGEYVPLLNALLRAEIYHHILAPPSPFLFSVDHGAFKIRFYGKYGYNVGLFGASGHLHVARRVPRLNVVFESPFLEEYIRDFVRVDSPGLFLHFLDQVNLFPAFAVADERVAHFAVVSYLRRYYQLGGVAGKFHRHVGNDRRIVVDGFFSSGFHLPRIPASCHGLEGRDYRAGTAFLAKLRPCLDIPVFQHVVYLECEHVPAGFFGNGGGGYKLGLEFYGYVLQAFLGVAGNFLRFGGEDFGDLLVDVVSAEYFVSLLE